MINFKTKNIAILLSNLLFFSYCISIFSACAQTTYRAESIQTKTFLDDHAVIDAQAQHAIKVEVSVTAKVKKLLAEDVQGLPHQRFLIELSNGTTILIAHDLKMAPPVPINAGDIVTIRGEYIWNKLGGLIHWTHHTDTPRHENGWIDFQGQRYQ